VVGVVVGEGVMEGVTPWEMVAVVVERVEVVAMAIVLAAAVREEAAEELKLEVGMELEIAEPERVPLRPLTV
jgi:hypothetical protein